jgi:hypothetical protein
MTKLLIFLAALFSSSASAQNNSEPSAPLPIINGIPVETGDKALRRMAEALEERSCNGPDRWFYFPTSVAESIGGKVKEIHIVRFVSDGTPPTIDAMRQTVGQVWQGKFQSPSCFINWAEGAMWSIEAIVLFDDGKAGEVYTDGFHVAFQDHNGHSWFVRLLPAAQ